MIAVTPASAAASTASRIGKKASDASTLPLTLSPAFHTASTLASTLLIWPAPMPTVCLPRARTMAFERTCLTARHANRSDVISSSVGFLSVTTLRSSVRTSSVSTS